MKLISGAALDPQKYFSGSMPKAQGSSFDLSVGCIFDHSGAAVSSFTLEPGQMVQVLSEERFNLPDNVTGHVTYKTTLTQDGIWALTVGIVDPGWNGQIATTLLNFSKVDHMVHTGDKFLRVTLFEHDVVDRSLLRTAPPPEEYRKQVKSRAATRFPLTFLNYEKIADDTGKRVMDKIRNQALAWLGVSAILFTAIQVFAPPVSKALDQWWFSAPESRVQENMAALEGKVQQLEERLLSLSAALNQAAATSNLAPLSNPENSNETENSTATENNQILE